MQIYIHPWISSAAFISVRRNETRPIGVHNLFRLWIVPSYVIRRWRLRAVGRYICKGQIQSDGVLDKGTWIWKRGQSGKWTIDFPCHKRARARLYSRRCRNESGLEEEEEGGGDDDLLQIPNDGYEIDLCGQRWGHLFHSCDLTHCLYISLPSKMAVKISLLLHNSLLLWDHSLCALFRFPPSIDRTKIKPSINVTFISMSDDSDD